MQQITYFMLEGTSEYYAVRKETEDYYYIRPKHKVWSLGAYTTWKRKLKEHKNWIKPVDRLFILLLFGNDPFNSGAHDKDRD